MSLCAFTSMLRFLSIMFREKTQSNNFCQCVLPPATMEPTVLDTKVFLADGSVESVAWKAWPSSDASHETNSFMHSDSSRLR